MAKRTHKPRSLGSRSAQSTKIQSKKDNSPRASSPKRKSATKNVAGNVAGRHRSAQRPRASGLSRINKVLASAGFGSRRQVEELILQGRVEVNGETISDLSTKVDPASAKVKVDGGLLKLPRMVYYALNKPKGVLSTNWDPSGRMRVIDLVPDRQRVFSVGRLDQHSEGLMLLTNDGELAQRLAHPRFRIQKCYFVVVAGVMKREELNRLRKGVYLAEGVARIDGARIRKVRKTCTELEIILSEGKNREIRRILARAGHKVVLLRRIAIGSLRLGELPVGAARELTASEVKSLWEATTARPRTSRAAGGQKQPPASKKAGSKPDASLKVSDPFDSSSDDDFGLGLEEETRYDDSVLGVDWPEDPSGDPEEDTWDDDFVVDVQSLNKTGRILVDGDDYAATGKGDRKRNRSNRSDRSASKRKSTQGSQTSPKRHPSQSKARGPAKPAGRGKPKAASDRGIASKTGPKGAARKPARGRKRKGR